jgi:hypothetical protein
VSGNLIFYIVCALGLASCQASLSGSGRTNSILVIAVDQFRPSDLDCGRESKSENTTTKPRPNTSGFEILCQNSYRFSHVYTTSTLSAPAMTSILTGQYPLAHGVHHNGDYLSPQIETVSERAFELGYDTTFFSGGAPVLRKTGLPQGFNLFDDFIKLQPTILHRTFKNSAAIFKARLKEIGSTPFFSVFYLPDLRFTQVATTNSLGEARNFSYESQLEELDDSLGDLFQFLKTEKHWENTHIVVVGLNGRAHGLRKKSSPTPTNLHSENTQIALFWKPAGSSLRDPPVSNIPLSLADVGASLYEWVDGQAAVSEIAELPILSLNSVTASSIPPVSRWILSESGWAAWRLNQPLQVSVRKDQILCLNEVRSSWASGCYNTIVDKDEVFDLPQNDALLKESQEERNNFLKKFKVVDVDTAALRLPTLSKIDGKSHPCYQVIERGLFETPEAKKCDDLIIQDLMHWIAAEQNPQVESSKRDQVRKRFLRSLAYELTDRKVAEMQAHLNWTWDVPIHLMVQKSLLDQIFEIPQIAKVRAQAYRAMSQFRDE